jgi:two-component system, response regulator PdtaR
MSSCNVVPLTTAAVSEKPHTVLVVEDEVLIRLMIADRLRDHSIGVVEASSAAEAVTVLQSQISVDLVFTDVRMNGQMSGIALAHLVRETRPDLKVVIASGDLTVDNATDAADAFFRKPYDLDRVVRRIEELMGHG